MNLLEAKRELKEHGYSVRKLNEGCYSGSATGGCGGYTDTYETGCYGGKRDPHAGMRWQAYCGGGGEWVKATAGSSRPKYNKMSQKDLEDRRNKIAANKAKLAEFEEKKLPKLAKLFGVAADKAHATQSAGKVQAYFYLNDEDRYTHDAVYITYSKEGAPEYFRLRMHNQEFQGSLKDVKTDIKELEEVINVLQTVSKIK